MDNLDIIFSRVHATLQPALSVGRSVGHTLFFLSILFLKVILGYSKSFQVILNVSLARDLLLLA